MKKDFTHKELYKLMENSIVSDILLIENQNVCCCKKGDNVKIKKYNLLSERQMRNLIKILSRKALKRKAISTSDNNILDFDIDGARYSIINKKYSKKQSISIRKFMLNTIYV